MRSVCGGLDAGLHVVRGVLLEGLGLVVEVLSAGVVSGHAIFVGEIESRNVVSEDVELVVSVESVVVPVNSPASPSVLGRESGTGLRVDDGDPGGDIVEVNNVGESSVVELGSDNVLVSVLDCVEVVVDEGFDVDGVSRLTVDGGPEVRGADDVLNIGHSVDFEDLVADLLRADDVVGTIREVEGNSHVGLVPVGPSLSFKDALAEVERDGPEFAVIAHRSDFAYRIVVIPKGDIEIDVPLGKSGLLREFFVDSGVRIAHDGRDCSENNSGNSNDGKNRCEQGFLRFICCIHRYFSTCG